MSNKAKDRVFDFYHLLREEFFTRVPHKHDRFQVTKDYAFCQRCYKELP